MESFYALPEILARFYGSGAAVGRRDRSVMLQVAAYAFNILSINIFNFVIVSTLLFFVHLSPERCPNEVCNRTRAHFDIFDRNLFRFALSAVSRFIFDFIINWSALSSFSVAVSRNSKASDWDFAAYLIIISLMLLVFVWYPLLRFESCLWSAKKFSMRMLFCCKKGGLRSWCALQCCFSSLANAPTEQVQGRSCNTLI